MTAATTREQAAVTVRDVSAGVTTRESAAHTVGGVPGGGPDLSGTYQDVYESSYGVGALSVPVRENNAVTVRDV